MPFVKALSYRYSDYLKTVSAPPSYLEAGYPTYGSYSQSAGLGLSRLSVSLLVSAPSVNPFITITLNKYSIVCGLVRIHGDLGFMGLNPWRRAFVSSAVKDSS